ncbi:MAG: hypothetical protein ABJB09_07720, partial [Verrucomicrobiota bacterium]
QPRSDARMAPGLLCGELEGLANGSGDAGLPDLLRPPHEPDKTVHRHGYADLTSVFNDERLPYRRESESG